MNEEARQSLEKRVLEPLGDLLKNINPSLKELEKIIPAETIKKLTGKEEYKKEFVLLERVVSHYIKKFTRQNKYFIESFQRKDSFDKYEAIYWQDGRCIITRPDDVKIWLSGLYLFSQGGENIPIGFKTILDSNKNTLSGACLEAIKGLCETKYGAFIKVRPQEEKDEGRLGFVGFHPELPEVGKIITPRYREVEQLLRILSSQ